MAASIERRNGASWHYIAGRPAPRAAARDSVLHFEADASKYFFGLPNCGSWASLTSFRDLVKACASKPERIKMLLPRFIDYIVWHGGEK
ncbi:MAG: hypothetical protein AAB229_06940, partial [Candidatus Hydrogenedentota bacterium]